MSIADLAALTTAGAALITAIAHRGRTAITIHQLRQALRLEIKARQRCQDRLSALETEMITVRKLLPGGEWHRKLGLEDPA